MFHARLNFIRPFFLLLKKYEHGKRNVPGNLPPPAPNIKILNRSVVVNPGHLVRARTVAVPRTSQGILVVHCLKARCQSFLISFPFVISILDSLPSACRCISCRPSPFSSRFIFRLSLDSQVSPSKRGDYSSLYIQVLHTLITSSSPRISPFFRSPAVHQDYTEFTLFNIEIR